MTDDPARTSRFYYSRVTTPNENRDNRGIEAGDEIMIKPPTDEESLAEGYQKRADRSRQLVEEMKGASAETTERLGAAPEWGN